VKEITTKPGRGTTTSTTVTHPDGSTTTTDSSGSVTVHTADGTVKYTESNGYSLVTRPDGSRVETTPTEDGWKETVHDRLGNKISVTYGSIDAKGQVTEESLPPRQLTVPDAAR
jgi:hypothetical protein